MFPGLEIVESHPFHVTRDAEVAIQELESDDLLESVEEAVWRRRFRKAVRLQTDSAISDGILEILIENLEIAPDEVFRVPGPLDLSRLRQLPSLDRPELRDEPFEPWVPPDLSAHADEDMFTVIREGDRLLHHPYESFQPVIDLLQKAAHDPDVLAIKMTLYRVGRNSPIVQALLEAIENGKQVAVLVELKARFDEESNIEWARALEREGVHVVYGLVGLKVHCKIALIVRREQDGIRRYLHLGTGNYNATTARLYTDFSLFTCNPDLGADATDLFNYLTGYSHKSDFRKLLVAPVTLRKRMAALIRREMAHGPRGRLIFKMNALEDRAMIRLLYEASRAGVRIDLIVRGLCCLRPGHSGRQRKHHRQEHRGAISGTQPLVLFRERRQGRNLHGQRGSDAAKSRPARGDPVPDSRSRDRAPPARFGAREVPRGQPQSPHRKTGRHVRVCARPTARAPWTARRGLSSTACRRIRQPSGHFGYAVAHVHSLGEEDHVFGDIGRVVRDALQLRAMIR